MLRTLPESCKSCWQEYLNKVVNACNCTRNDSTGYSPFYLLFDRHPRLPIDLIFDIDQAVHSKSHIKYTKKRKAAIEEAYSIVRKQSSTSAERNKHHYDKKAKSVDLQPNNCVLLRNLFELGQRCACCYRRKDPLSPVYELKREADEGPSRVLHRNLLLPCNDLPIETSTPRQKPQNKFCQNRNRRPRALRQLQNRVNPAEEKPSWIVTVARTKK